MSDGSTPNQLPNGGVLIRSKEGERLSDACLAEANADRGGAVPLLPLLWQGDLPGLPGADAMYVRDLGPTENARLIERFPRRRVVVLLRHPDEGNLAIVPYDAAMEMLWGSPLVENDGT